MTDENVNDQVDETPEAAPAPAPPPDLEDGDEQPELTPETFHRAIETAGDTPVDSDEPAAVEPGSEYDLTPVILEDESIPQEYRESLDTAEALTEVSGFAKTAGIKPALAKTLVAAYASLALSEQDHLPDIHDDEAVERYMAHQYGPAEARAIITAAQEATKSLGKKFSQWLDRTRLGSHPSMLLLLSGLAKDGLFKVNTPEQARDAMKKYRADKNHPVNKPGSRGYASARAQWRLLSALANMENDADASERLSEKMGRQALKDRRTSSKADPKRMQLETEARTIRESPEYYRGGPSARALSARLRQIYVELYPEDK